LVTSDPGDLAALARQSGLARPLAGGRRAGWRGANSVRAEGRAPRPHQLPGPFGQVPKDREGLGSQGNRCDDAAPLARSQIEPERREMHRLFR